MYARKENDNWFIKRTGNIKSAGLSEAITGFFGDLAFSS
jgi:hypothetical protein